MSYHTKRLLRSFQRADEGNWRLKGLMLAALSGHSETVADAWPTTDRFLSEGAKRNPITMMSAEDTVVPAHIPEDTQERALARSAFSEQEFEDAVPRDHYIKRVLAADGRYSGEALDVLWREELLNSVIMGAEPVKVARDAATVLNVSKSTGDIPRGAAQVYAPIIAEGAEITMDAETFDTVSYDTKKIAQGFAISEKLIDNAEPDVLERQVRFAGAAVENRINRMWLTEVINASNINEVDTTHSATTKNIVQAINEAAGEVEGANFGATDTLLMHPEFKTELFSDTNLIYANRSGSDEVLRNRTYNQLLGAMLYTGADGAEASDSSQTWGWAADGEIGGVVYRKDMTGVVMWKDMEMKEFEDPIRDLVGGNVRSYADAVTMQPKALTRLEY